MPELTKLPTPTKTAPSLKVPQVRVLVALLPASGDDPPRWSMPRFELAAAAGFIPTTGSINRALNGVPPGSSSGDSHDGLLTLHLVEKVMIDLDGQAMDSYRITKAGIEKVRAWLSHNNLPPPRDAKISTNHRYAVDDTLD